MKNLKRLIALVAVFALALTTIASAATFTDVAEDSAYYEAVETLTKLGIVDGMPDGTYQPEKVVTRAEMAKLIATMQGLGDTAQSGSTTKFSDVPASHWASGFIANATGVAINGYPDGTFGPANNVKFEEAVKMIMATLGYTVVANGNGGYPMGYVTAAIKEGVTDNVANANVGTDANRGTIAQLIYNAIDTPLVEQITWEADGSGEYTKYDGTSGKAYKTLMSENLDVVKVRATIIANSYLSIDDTIPVSVNKEDEPVVWADVKYAFKAATELYDATEGANNKHDFYVADSDVEDYIGKTVVMFAMENDYDKWEVISVAEDSSYNKSLTFALSNFDAAKSDTTKLYYFKDGASTSTKATLQSSYTVISNNDVVASDSIVTLISGLKLYGGQVTLLDTDTINGYDKVFVEAAISAIVGDVNESVIILDEGRALPDTTVITEIDTDDNNVIVKLTKNGEEITVDEVAADDILSIVAYNSGENYIIVDVMSNIVEGTISSKKTSKTSWAEGGGTAYAYKVDGTWYDVAAGCDMSLSAGDSAKLYIDKYGKIAHYDKITAGGSGNYAYVLDTLTTINDWNEATCEIKILTKDGIKTYTTTEKFTIYADEDGDAHDLATVTSASLATDKTTAINDAIKGQVVDVNMSGDKIKSIVTAWEEDEFDVVGNIEVNDVYDAEVLEIGGKECDEDSIVFYIEASTDDCYVGTLADLEDQYKVTTAGIAYADANVKGDANILVLKNAGTGISPASNLAVVVAVEDSTNEDEEDVAALTVLYKGAEVTYTTTEAMASAALALTPGDIIKIKVTGTGIITNLAVVFNFAEDVKPTTGTVIDVASAHGPYGAFDPLVATDDEFFDGGDVKEYKNKRATLFSGNRYSFNDCEYIYVIDATKRDLSVSTGAAASFRYNSYLINEDSDGNKIAEYINAEIDGVVYAGAAVADKVIFRVVEGDAVEAIIIKGESKYKTTTDAVTVTP